MAQQQYSVGDQMRVSLGGAVYTAAVIKVHVGDANDVVFAKAGNVGVSLTANHILELELMGEVVQVRVYLNRCSWVTCSVRMHVCLLRNFCLTVLTHHAIQQTHTVCTCLITPTTFS